jgi:hypothetical protein
MFGGASKKMFAPLIEELRRWRPILEQAFMKQKTGEIGKDMIPAQGST